MNSVVILRSFTFSASRSRPGPLLAALSILFAAVLASAVFSAQEATKSLAGSAIVKDAAGPQAMMKAVCIHEYGGIDKLKYEDVPRPTPADDEMLVRVHAAGINPVDDKIRSGAFSAFTNYRMPLILGWDVSGVVEQVGKKVTKYKVGDAVFAYMNIQKPGAYAEFAVVREADACPKPAKLTHIQAAAIPLAATTAWQALVDNAKLEKGQTVLIHGAAGGVGHFAVQIAKARGAKVIATGSTKSLPFLKELGADVSIDYTAAKFEDIAKDVDVVLDTIGGDTQQRSFNVLKKGGVLVSVVQPPDQALAKERGVRALIFLAHPDGPELAEIVKLVDAGKLKPTVSKTFPLSEASKAHEQIETKHTKGKIVLEVVESAAPIKSR
jgi:NADPH:quinone reductase-like Zn-dependent oxidoreductase